MGISNFTKREKCFILFVVTLSEDNDLRKKYRLLIIIAVLLIVAGCEKNRKIAETPSDGQHLTDVPATDRPVLSPTNTPTPTNTQTPTPTPTPTVNFPELKTQYEADGERRTAELKKIEDEKNLPAVFITTEGFEDIRSREVYQNAVVDIVNCADEYRLSKEAKVRVRGNSSALDETETHIIAEPPYKIKFMEKQGVLGMHDGKKFKEWVLLRPMSYMINDALAFKLGNVLSDGKYYASDSCYVNVYVNYVFKGVYLLAEQNEAKKNRVDVDEPKEGDESVKTGYFLEINNYYWRDYQQKGQPYFMVDYAGASVTDILGEKKKFNRAGYTIHTDTYGEAQKEFISKYVNNVFKIVYEASVNNNYLKFDEKYDLVNGTEFKSPEEAISEVLDLDSVVISYLINEILGNVDRGEGSFFMAVDFSEKSRFKKLTFLAPWDFEWTATGAGYYNYFAATFTPDKYIAYGERGNPWFITLMSTDWFRRIVRDKFDGYKAADLFEKCINDILDQLKAAGSDVSRDGSGMAGNVRSKIAFLDKALHSETVDKTAP